MRRTGVEPACVQLTFLHVRSVRIYRRICCLVVIGRIGLPYGGYESPALPLSYITGNETDLISLFQKIFNKLPEESQASAWRVLDMIVEHHL